MAHKISYLAYVKILFCNFLEKTKKHLNCNHSIIIMSLIVKSNIKEVAGDMSVSGDFAEELEKKVVQIVKDACRRAQENSRRTVMAKDL